MNQGKVANKVAFVTGGASGMGAAASRLLEREGARVVIADVQDELGESLVSNIGANALYVHLDVTSQENWTQALRAAEEAFGPIDILVNCAGIRGGNAEIEEESEAHFRSVIDVNLLGPFLGIVAVSPSMKRRGTGSIVNIVSIAGLEGWYLGHPYTASKFGLRGLTKSVALDLGPYGIRVNSVHPGIVDTPMSAGADWYLNHIPLKRSGAPEEVAAMVLFLASDDSSYSTGAEFVVDGGQTAGFPGPVTRQQAKFVKTKY